MKTKNSASWWKHSHTRSIRKQNRLRQVSLHLDFCRCFRINDITFGPDFRKKCLRRTYEKLRKKANLQKNVVWARDFQKIVRNLMKNWGRSYAKLMINLRRHYRYLTKKVKFVARDLGNPLSEAVIGRILWAKINWQPELQISWECFQKWLTIFLRISCLTDLQKTYENLTTNLRKILRKSYKVSNIGQQDCNSVRSITV